MGGGKVGRGQGPGGKGVRKLVVVVAGECGERRWLGSRGGGIKGLVGIDAGGKNEGRGGGCCRVGGVGKGGG